MYIYTGDGHEDETRNIMIHYKKASPMFNVHAFKEAIEKVKDKLSWEGLLERENGLNCTFISQAIRYQKIPMKHNFGWKLISRS